MSGGRPDTTLALTMGDPCGIGPEICVKALAGERAPADANVVVVGAGGVLSQAAETVGAPVPGAGSASGVTLLDLDNFPTHLLACRGPTAESGRASLDYIERAVRLILAGQADALVTAPINKEAIGAAGSAYPGHTEMLAALTGCDSPVMLLVRGDLRVSFVTTHLALKEVANAISSEMVLEAARSLHEALQRYFGIVSPRIAVCALNPHCGDGGRFGDEENRVIAPAIAGAVAKGLRVDGPFPADTLFSDAAGGGYDGIVAQYHDQGMIPIKLGGLADVVNVTLGLPFVRTSPGHGTAYDIAGTGSASEDSLVSALHLAARMASCAGRARPGR